MYIYIYIYGLVRKTGFVRLSGNLFWGSAIVYCCAGLGQIYQSGHAQYRAQPNTGFYKSFFFYYLMVEAKGTGLIWSECKSVQCKKLRFLYSNILSPESVDMDMKQINRISDLNQWFCPCVS